MSNATIVKDDFPHLVDRHVGKRVAERRQKLGYTQSDLGRALGLTFQQVQKYERGANRISASKLWAIADFFDVDVQHFFEGLNRASKGHATLQTDAPDRAATRSTVELARLVPQLSALQQKLVLDLVRQLIEADAKTTEAA